MVRPGASIPRFSRMRRMAAVFAVFVASGLVHEALFWWVLPAWVGAKGRGMRAAGAPKLLLCSC